MRFVSHRLSEDRRELRGVVAERRTDSESDRHRISNPRNSIQQRDHTADS